eukprot:scaffold32955_cov21-Tisochrysis_lutea.AAC.2
MAQSWKNRPEKTKSQAPSCARQGCLSQQSFLLTLLCPSFYFLSHGDTGVRKDKNIEAPFYTHPAVRLARLPKPAVLLSFLLSPHSHGGAGLEQEHKNTTMLAFCCTHGKAA